MNWQKMQTSLYGTLDAEFADIWNPGGVFVNLQVTTLNEYFRVFTKLQRVLFANNI